jgi:hypothetical protein
MEQRWQIELLGGLRTTRHQQVVTRFRTRKTGAWLAYLACHRDCSHPREVLIELLWPESDPKSGQNRLSRVLTSQPVSRLKALRPLERLHGPCQVALGLLQGVNRRCPTLVGRKLLCPDGACPGGRRDGGECPNRKPAVRVSLR